MKSMYGLLLAAFVLAIASCKETPPYINMVPTHVATDSTSVFLPAPTPQPRSILIEEFTGVRCPNCPAAQLEAATIANNNPDRVYSITIHPLGKLTSLTMPFSESIGDKHTSKYDFRTVAGAKIFDLVGVTSSLPTGNVNRKLYSGETNRNIDYQKWAVHATAELNTPTPVNISMSAKNVNDSISIDVTLVYTEMVVDTPHYLTLAIVESGMIDYQENTVNGVQVIEDNYEHKHILRAVVTDYYGDVLKAKLEPGRIFFKRYTFKRDPAWTTNKLDVVGFVHLNTSKQEVLHAKEVHVD